MRIAVLADTHLPRGGRRLPDECVAELRAADMIVHAGDFVRLPVLADLRSLGPSVVAVHGNMDDAGLRAELPATATVDAGGATIGVVHDAGPRVGREARLVARFPGCDAVVYGHTHVPQVERHAGVWIVNPGSPTERRRAPARSMLVVEAHGGVLEPRLLTLT